MPGTHHNAKGRAEPIEEGLGGCPAPNTGYGWSTDTAGDFPKITPPIAGRAERGLRHGPKTPTTAALFPLYLAFQSHAVITPNASLCRECSGKWVGSTAGGFPEITHLSPRGQSAKAALVTRSPPVDRLPTRTQSWSNCACVPLSKGNSPHVRVLPSMTACQIASACQSASSVEQPLAQNIEQSSKALLADQPFDIKWSNARSGMPRHGQ